MTVTLGEGMHGCTLVHVNKTFCDLKGGNIGIVEKA